MCGPLVAAASAVFLMKGVCGTVFEDPLEVGMENPLSRLRNHVMLPMYQRLGAEASIEATPTTITDGGVVTVTMDASNDPAVPRNSSCLIGAYAPAGSDVSQFVPARLAPCNVDSSFESTGKAVLQFELTNVHSEYSFHVFSCNKPRYRDQQPTCVELGRSTHNVTFSDFGKPFRVRVLPPSEREAYPRTLDVAWSADAAGSPFVEFGTKQGGPYTRTVSASPSRMNKADLCGAPAATFGWQDPLVVNRASLPGLTPGSTVYYRVGDTALPATAVHPLMANVTSEEYTLTVPMVEPVDGETNATEDERAYADSVGVIFIADMGRGNDPAVDSSESYSEYGYTSLYTARTLAKYAYSGNTSSTVLVGDVSYATGFQPVWNEYLRMIEPYASRIPNYVGLGNHENCVPEDRMPPGRVPYLYNWTDSGGECGVPTNFHLPMPWKNLDETWYAAEVHPRISVVMMSSEHNYLPGSKQLKELDDLLQSIRDKRGPKHHIVFLNHRPAYINSEYPGDTKWSGDQRVASMLREFVEPLFRKYNVSLALYGHNHSVQRHCAAFAGNCTVRSKALEDLTRSELNWLDSALDGSPRSPLSQSEQQSLRANGVESDANGWWDRNDDDVIDAAKGEVLQERVYLGAQDAVHMVIGTAGAGYTNNAKPVSEGGPEYNERFFYLHGFLHLTAPSPDVLRYQWVYSRTGQVLEVGTIVRSGAPPPGKHSGWEALSKAEKGGVVAAACVGGASLAALALYFVRTKPYQTGSDAAYAPIGGGAAG